MIIQFAYKNKNWTANLNQWIDISISFKVDNQVNCFFAPEFSKEPVISGDFVGSTASGGFLNFFNLTINPHGNGTHTESVQHLDHRGPDINTIMQKQHFVAQLITIQAKESENNDFVIDSNQFPYLKKVDALIIRTAPNRTIKKEKQYSGSNPIYMTQAAMQIVKDMSYNHLLIDLPSVDREEDGGALVSHKTFWDYPSSVKSERSITELIFVPSHVQDGLYLLNLNPAPIVNDASPSRPVIYPLMQIDDEAKV